MVANCVNNKVKLKQSNFERKDKKVLVFEHFSLQNATLKTIALNNSRRYYVVFFPRIKNSPDLRRKLFLRFSQLKSLLFE